MGTRIVAVALVVQAAWAATAHAQVPPEAIASAQAALPRLLTLAKSTQGSGLGLKGDEPPDRLALDEGVPQRFVRLDKVSAFAGNQPVDTLLLREAEYFFPVKLDGRVRTSIAVRCEGNVCKAAAFGRPRLAQAVDVERDVLANQYQALHPGKPTPPYALVHFGGFGNYYLAYKDPDTGIWWFARPPGPGAAPVSRGEELFGVLSKQAQNFNGLPQ